MELKMANVTRLVPARSAEVLTECQKLASRQLPGSLKTVLDKVDDALFELANKADNSQRQNLYFDAMRELRLKRDSFEAKFINSFNTEFESSIDLEKVTAKTAAFAPEMELALVECDDVEESLALTNFVESMRAKCKEQLFGLDRRIGYLLSRPDLLDEDNPIGPRVIGDAFRAACEQLESGIEVKLTLFKMFDKFAGHGIHQLYSDLNDFLVQRDILPKVTASIQPGGGGRRTRVIIESEEDRIEATGPDVFSTLQSLMTAPAPGFTTGGGSGYAPVGAPMGPGAHVPGGEPGTTVPGAGAPPTGRANGTGIAPAGTTGGTVALGTTHVVDTLTLLQQGNLSGLQDTGGEVLDRAQIEAGDFNVLRTLRETGAIGELNQTDGLTLDIVSILFDYILDDPAIPDAMKALIGRLQIPMLKVALLDKALFSKKTHPARKLLDGLAAAAVGWSETQRTHDGLYDLVDKIVRSIVDEFEDDLSLFENALAQLDAYLAEENDEVEKRTAESTRSLRTREQIVLAKMTVDDAINERIAGLEIREFIRQFLVDYWRQLLIITHVEHGIDNEIWQEQLQTIDDLVWSVQNKTTPQDRKALTEKLPRLLKNIKRGMTTLEMDPPTCSKFLSMLASVHVVSVKHTEETSLAERHLLQGSQDDEPLTTGDDDNEAFVRQGLARLFERKGVDAEELDIDLSVFDDGTEPESEPTNLPPDIMEFVEQVTDLDLGDWVQFENDDGSTTRARFTWISPATGRYLFTTRQGQKALDTTLTGLADQFARGVAQRVDTQPDPIFDRAIGDLMDKLEDQQSTG